VQQVLALEDAGDGLGVADVDGQERARGYPSPGAAAGSRSSLFRISTVTSWVV
jgi:hypothetical protein